LLREKSRDFKEEIILRRKEGERGMGMDARVFRRVKRP